MSKLIAAIVVTYNRLELLKLCIDSIRNQSFKINKIIVINNNSTDKTEIWLKNQNDIYYITQPNGGGSYGFYTGIKIAYKQGYEWFWCMDDDTVANKDALENIVKSPLYKDKSTGLLASYVSWIDGSPHRMNIPQFVDSYSFVTSFLSKQLVPIVSCSFVSVLISRVAVSVSGLPIKEFFIWYDDVEYTSRISDKMKAYWCLDSVVVHMTKENRCSLLDDNLMYKLPNQDFKKYSIGLRNKIYIIKRGKYHIINKFILIGTIIRNQVRLILKGYLPSNILLSCAQGIVFSPKIEYLE
jgi:GT2 family glycosyltransferase